MLSLAVLRTRADRKRRGETAPYASSPAPLDAPLQRGRTGQQDVLPPKLAESRVN
jgi:hypothetical protein